VINTVDCFTIEECRKIPGALGDFPTSTLLEIYPQSEYEISILMANTLRVPSHEGVTVRLIALGYYRYFNNLHVELVDFFYA
jgi:hypothetical protein